MSAGVNTAIGSCTQVSILFQAAAFPTFPIARDALISEKVNLLFRGVRTSYPQDSEDSWFRFAG